MPIVDVVAEEDVLTIHRDHDSAQDYFLPFPYRMMGSGDELKVMRTTSQVLCTFVCEEALAWMHNTLTGLLEGLAIQIDEINLKLINIPRKTVIKHPDGYQHPNWPGHSHDVLRMTSVATSNQWIIDLTGGQYGIPPAFWSSASHSSHYVEKVEHVYPFGTHKEQKALEADIWGNSTLDCGVVGEVDAHMDIAVKAWGVKRNIKLSDLVQLSHKQFLVVSKQLTDHMSSVTRAFVKGLDITAKVRAIRLYEIFPANRQLREAERAKIINQFLKSSDTLKNDGKGKQIPHHEEFGERDFDPASFFRDLDKNMGDIIIQVPKKDGTSTTITF